MLRICQNCGITFEGKPAALKCPKCTAAVRQSSLGQRICRGCGQSFQGGPHAWYCPDCREEREKKKKVECNARQKAGTTRRIGSTDFCTICGKEYTVTSGNQRYCPSCAPDAIRKIDREQSRNWAKENNPPEKRRTANQAGLFCGYFGFIAEFFPFIDLHVDLHPKDKYLTYPYYDVCVLHRDGYIFSMWLLHLHAPFARMPVPHLLPQNT